MEGPQNRWSPPISGLPLPLVKAGTFVAEITPMQIAIGVAVSLVAIGVVALMRASTFGRNWRAIADDAVMANLMGLSSRRLLMQTFALASALAGLAGFILTARFGGADATSGEMIGLKGLVAAVLGGIGSIEGALLGGLVLGLFEALWQAYMPIDDTPIAVMVLLVATLIFRPGGLFGFAEAGPRQV
jgi:branched-chain amino acid transport system permease protein